MGIVADLRGNMGLSSSGGRGLEGSAFVYCPTIRETERVADALRGEGLSVGVYHAKAPNREEVHRAFIRDEIGVMCATVAYGMARQA